ncbi:DUF302 domain-containing protein [Photobacterium sanctipauli]|uniref:DUF302 domain-containing protein n=2 Tax=Photobacterium sanctipauli TaxID=1342794 RepID=A0A2T3NX71_9GAMM|nr:DUF302 domain-containing protein [Photobacterium sanctipauli]
MAKPTDIDGLEVVSSPYTVEQTVENLVKVLEENNMSIFGRINHAKAAQEVEIDLRPTELVIFGNPKVGSKLMQCQQSMGIDLPLKVLVFEDEDGKVWLSYNAPSYLEQRHKLVGCNALGKKIATSLAEFSEQATKK